MKEKPTGNGSSAEPKTDWQRLHTLTDDEIHAALATDEDIHPTDEQFWQTAKVVMPRHKEVVTLRLDADLLAWFRQEKGYQTKINAILRAYMATQTSSSQPYR